MHLQIPLLSLLQIPYPTQSKFLSNSLLIAFRFPGDITGRVRLRSEGVERGISGSLPDVVPDQYKRPVSLPDLVDLQRQTEQETGRELRRIGDEFDSYYNERKVSYIYSLGS